MKYATLSVNKKTRVRGAAIVLAVLQQGVASYGYADECVTEYLPEIIVRAPALSQPELSDEMHQQAETTIAALRADNNVSLEQHMRRSTREALAAAVPTDETAPHEVAPEAVVQNQGFDAANGETDLPEPSG